MTKRRPPGWVGVATVGERLERIGRAVHMLEAAASGMQSDGMRDDLSSRRGYFAESVRETARDLSEELYWVNIALERGDVRGKAAPTDDDRESRRRPHRQLARQP